MEKTPISRLQEICAHNGLQPEYQLLSVEGVVHAPTFIYRVQAGEVTATATGQSKKKAKHAVARRAIEMIITESDYQVEEADTILEIMKELSLNDSNETDPDAGVVGGGGSSSGDGNGGCGGGGGGDDSTGSYSLDNDTTDDSNPVGKLQEICMKRHWRPPLYETISEEGLPHERVFKMKCIIENMDFSETGVAKSKRLAKRKAALLMIKRLKDENLADDDINDKNGQQFESTFIDNFIESKTSGQVIPAKVKLDNFLKLDQFTEDVHENINKLIADCLDDDNNITTMGLQYDTDYLTKLLELTKQLDCQFKVLTVPQLSYSNTYQCMIHVIPNDITYTDLPVLTSWGTSEQLEDAKQTAAGNAIKLFSLLKEKHVINKLSVNKNTVKSVQLAEIVA
ncbi:RISC-loading complex subunit tarbp2-like [Oppia nitens]|uniref:RISC-loading complex subunit tarbp2-like n=1 Tax=Oppia nitens TaxID=1686743 RepID=UPI0023DCB96F|nr:RISC-loading complex subunit tarbp2-like [Oppia nitens]